MFAIKIIATIIFLLLCIFVIYDNMHMYPYLKNIIIGKEKDEHIREEKIRQLRHRTIVFEIYLFFMMAAAIFLLFIHF